MAVTVRFKLGSAVADTGTVAFAYPSGLAQADFTGDNASATGIAVINDNDVYTEASDDIGLSYGASEVTLTNDSGVTWPASSTVLVELGRVQPIDEFVQVAAVANLELTPLATEDTYTDAAANAQFDEVEDKLNAILSALRSAGVISPS